MKNNQKHNRAVIRRVPLDTIVKAKNGDNTVLEKILRHYQGYMLKLSQFELYDASGTVYTCLDEELFTGEAGHDLQRGGFGASVPMCRIRCPVTTGSPSGTGYGYKRRQ